MRRLQLILSAFFICAWSAATFADVQLPAIFADRMVVQQRMPAPVWGSADPGERVSVRFAGQEKSTVADADGQWKILLDPLAASDNPGELVVAGNNTLRLIDVQIGQVWLCAGQSNMAWPVRAAMEGNKEVAHANFPNIRLFKVSHQAVDAPSRDMTGKWQVCSPRSVGDFSAVAYFFGRELHHATNEPIGLIECSWAGTTGEAWADARMLRDDPRLTSILEEFEQQLPQMRAAREKYEQRLAEWRENAYYKDPGDAGSARGWSGPAFDDSEWKTIRLPGKWEETIHLDLDGAIWFRKRITVPQNWIGQPLKLLLGSIDDYDTTFVNGRQVGTVFGDNAQSRNVPRDYVVPAEAIVPGENVIAVRVFDVGGSGGFLGPAGRMKIAPESRPTEAIALNGGWKFAVEAGLSPKRGLRAPPMEPPGLNTAAAPANIYNGMIHPLASFAINGALWYQGESNVGRAAQYRALLPAIASGWRKAWGQGDFPFVIVQLPNFRPRGEDAKQVDSWARLRETQLQSAKTIPNAALAVTIDIGDPRDMHPRNKQEAGRRAALAAMKISGTRDVAGTGPMFKEMVVNDDRAILTFDTTDCRLMSRRDQLKGFTIAGADRIFTDAEAQIVGDSVVVSSPAVKTPQAVRYAWADNPEVSLYNAEGLPASPFRTDDWPLDAVK
jgi:sialate O-acetylesterase